MIELREEADGRLSRGYGGDTLNTAIYLSRLGTPVDYVTALGDDSWSDELIAAWDAEGSARAGFCACRGACRVSTSFRRMRKASAGFPIGATRQPRAFCSRRRKEERRRGAPGL